MSQKEIERLGVIKRLEMKAISQKEAASLMRLTTRQVRNLYKKYKLNGPSGLVSKRRGRQSNNRLCPSKCSKALEIIKSTYYDFGPTLIHEKLTEEHGFKLSVESVRQLMIKEGLWKRKLRKTAISHQMRQRRSSFGELVQIDGSLHHWFEDRGPQCCLIVFIDDATGKLLALHFIKSECIEGYFKAIRQHLKFHGKPLAYYSDRHGIFRVNAKEALSGTGETQVSRALRELDITLINANSPQAKGRVERANGTLQDRLVKEMRLEGISDIKSANAYLPSFIDKFNKRFAKIAANPHNAHRPVNLSQNKLNRILCEKSIRTISKNLEVHYKNQILQIQVHTPSYSMRGAKVEVSDNNGYITLIYKGKTLPFRIFIKDKYETPIADRKQINDVIDRRTRGHKPPSNHPWKQWVENKSNPNGVQQR